MRMIGSTGRHGVGMATVAAAVGCALGAGAGEAPVSFNRDVRPILSENCFQCHGPDRLQRKGGLRLDIAEDSAGARGGRRMVLPGQPEKAPLYRRVVAHDALRMPPVSSGKHLTSAQVATLRRWIAQGGRWEQHWAFSPPKLPAVPRVRNAGWVRSPVDAFVLARIEQEGFAPMPEADRPTLIRRVTLDLTGVAPSPDEVDGFLRDTSADAYEKVVDRLLASPRFAERMAYRWLDAARYADTNGYQTDGERAMWRWRDWVIEAFHRDLPFDQFSVEQLAGDLLPNATLDQRIATGFNRNYRGNGEGGIIPEEYLVEYAVDRTDTFATVWLGLTAGCGRCHDHKFDPVTQKEYYRLLAFFNNLPEKGRANKYGNSAPVLPAPTREQQVELAALDARLAEREQRLRDQQPEIAAAQAAWERGGVPETADWQPEDERAAHFPLAAGMSTPAFDGGAAEFVPGVRGIPRTAVHFDGSALGNAGDVGLFAFQDRFSGAAWVYPEGDGTIFSRMTDEPRGDGYAMTLVRGHVQLNFVKRWLDDALRLESETALPSGQWTHLAFSYDGTRVASGVRLYINGRSAPLKIHLDELNQSFDTPKEVFRIGGGGGSQARFRGRIADLALYRRVLAPDEAAWLAVPETVGQLARLSAAERTEARTGKLTAAFHSQYGPGPLRRLVLDIRKLRKEREARVDSFPTVMVMEEANPPRPTHVLQRGQYNHPGEAVGAGTPALFAPLPAGTRANRLALARWLTHPDHPLTSRVAVNRVWQMLFGRGLVRTVEDFGSQGEAPTHPELLDWLAMSFTSRPASPSPANSLSKGTDRPERTVPSSRSRTSPAPDTPHPTPYALSWSLKQLVRLLVTSATYRQSSRVTPEMLKRDPENRLFARSPRLRLPAEMVRDQALLASGLLVEKQGGPSVKPYQPAGLWSDLSGGVDYVRDSGESLYRRSLYTFWKRTAPPPMLSTFDAAGRETCIVRESRTNTPLQALNLMNDVTYVEAARALAQRVLKGPAAGAEARVTELFRRVLSRQPRAEELSVLLRALSAQRARLRQNPAAAARLLGHGESKPDPALDPVELAAHTAVASLVLNLDEAVTRE